MMDWTVERIKELLEGSDEMVRRSVVKIWELQTEDEQAAGDTKHHNGVGFNGFDAPILSSFALQVKQGSKLSHRQIGIARKKLRKYASQLTRIANGTISR